MTENNHETLARLLGWIFAPSGLRQRLRKTEAGRAALVPLRAKLDWTIKDAVGPMAAAGVVSPAFFGELVGMRGHMEQRILLESRRWLGDDPEIEKDILRRAGYQVEGLGERIKKLRVETDQYLDPWSEPNVAGYMDSLQAHFSNIEMMGFPHLKDRPTAPINKLFVPLKIARDYVNSRQDGPGREARVEKDAQMAKGAMELGDMLDGHPQTVVLGDPGAGKTTLISWFCHAFSVRSGHPLSERLGPLIPIPIIIRDLRLNPGVDTWEKLLGLVRNQFFWTRGLEPYLPFLMDRGQLLFLIDGLDEASDPNTRRALSAIFNKMQERNPHTHLVATSRLLGYDEAPLTRPSRALDPRPDTDLPKARRDGLPIHYVRPFNQSQIRAFVERWFALREQNEIDRMEGSDGLLKALEMAPQQVAEMARRPSLLTMMALIYRVQANLPEQRVILFEKITEAYLESFDEARKLPRLPVPFQHQVRWLSAIAFEMQKRRIEEAIEAASNPRRDSRDQNVEDDILIEQEEARAILIKRFGQDPSHPANNEIIGLFFKHVARRAGILIPRSETQLVFAHLSLQEYFAALDVLDSFQTSFIKRDRYKEVMALLPGWVHVTPAHETFIQLFELLAIYSPGASDVVIDEILPEVVADDTPVHVIQGLAKLNNDLLADSSTGFSATKRKELQNKLDRHLRQLALLPMGYRNPPLPGWVEDLSPLSGLESLSRLVLNETQVSDLSPLSEMKSLSRLYLRGTQVLDLSPLSGLTSLSLLYLRGTRVSGLSPLSEMKSLSRLDLSGTQVSDLSPLSGLENLSQLDLNETQVSDLSPLSGLTSLSYLYLRGTQVLDLSPLSEMKSLSLLVLNETQVSDLSPLSEMKSLSRLDLNETQVSDLSPLSGLENLSVLDLNETQVSDLSPLSGLANLSRLDLNETQVSDLSPLSGLENLSQLDLNETQVSDLSPLSGLTSLSYLYLRGTQVSDLSPLSGLKSLSLLVLNETQVSDLSPLSGLENLSVLDLNETQVSDLSPLSEMKSLSQLYLRGTQVLDLSPLSGLTSLSYLYLDGTQVLDLSPLSNIKELRIITPDGVVRILNPSNKSNP